MKSPPADALLDLLSPFLEDSSPETVRSQAMEALACLRHPASIPHLLRHYGTESQEMITFLFQHALGSLKVREAIPRLVKNARIQKSQWIRQSACDALGSIGGPEAVAHLRDLFAHERSDAVRIRAAIGLARNGETDMIEHLENAFAGPDLSLARDVACYWLEVGNAEILDRIFLRMEPHPDQWGEWVRLLQRYVPQMPQRDPLLLLDPPLGRFKPRHVRGSLRWLERNRPFLRWDPDREQYLVPYLHIPA